MEKTLKAGTDLAVIEEYGRAVLSREGVFTRFSDSEDVMRKIALGVLLWVLLPVCVAGAALVDNGDGTVTDTQTGLMWQKATAPGTYNWQAALAYAEGLTLGGHSDWRLPDRNELQTLVDYSRYNPAIDPLLASNTVSSPYWSSTTYANDTNNAWRVYFSSGYVHYYGNKSNSYYVRAVRAGQSGSLGDSVILRGKVVAKDTGEISWAPWRGPSCKAGRIRSPPTAPGEFL